MFKRTLITAFLFSTAAAHASDYQFEVDGGYGATDSDYDDGENITLRGTYYFNPVNTDGRVVGRCYGAGQQYQPRWRSNYLRAKRQSL